MSVNNIFNRFCLSFLFVTGCCITVVGQADKKSDSDPKNQVSQEDLKQILETLNIDFFKYNVDIPKNKKYSFLLYRQEYEKRKLLKEEDILSMSLIETVEGDTIGRKTPAYIKIYTRNLDKEYFVNIYTSVNRTYFSLKIDTIYKNPHGCKPFKPISNITNDSIMPLLLIGSFWGANSPDGKISFQRFCFEKELETDLSNKAFDIMPHYFIIGLKVKEDY